MREEMEFQDGHRRVQDFALANGPAAEDCFQHAGDQSCAPPLPLHSPVNTCPDLPNPFNGRVVLTSTTFGSRATYTCETGYGLVGKGVQVCQADGTWSSTAPTCESMWICCVKLNS